MKRSITFREITLAIGVVVAMVIAVTFWLHKPGAPDTGNLIKPVSVGKVIKDRPITIFLKKINL